MYEEDCFISHCAASTDFSFEDVQREKLPNFPSILEHDYAVKNPFCAKSRSFFMYRRELEKIQVL